MTEQSHGQLIIAHRGASHDAPENTLAAFHEAWAQKADGIEGDYYFTTDNHIVCIHDEDTERTAGEFLSVPKCSLAQLQQLEYGGWKAAKFRGEPIPTLDDVLRCVPEQKLCVIELKTGPQIVPLLKKQLEESNIDRKQVLVIAFDENTVAESKRLMPDVRAHWLTSYKQNMLTGTWRPSAKQVAKTLKRCGADGLGTKGERAVVDKEFIETLRADGMQEFHVWTIDDPTDARYFQELGAVAITTNRPALIRRALQRP